MFLSSCSLCKPAVQNSRQKLKDSWGLLSQFEIRNKGLLLITRKEKKTSFRCMTLVGPLKSPLCWSLIQYWKFQTNDCAVWFWLMVQHTSGSSIIILCLFICHPLSKSTTFCRVWTISQSQICFQQHYGNFGCDEAPPPKRKFEY